MRLWRNLPARARWFWPTTVGLGVASIGVVVATLAVKHALDVVLALAVVASALAPTLVRQRQHRFDLFEPTFGGGVMLALLFGVRPLYIIVGGQYEYLGYQTEPQITAVIGLGLLGSVAFAIGYFWFRRGRVACGEGPTVTDEATGRPALRKSVVLVALISSVLGVGLFAVNLLRMGPPGQVIPLWLGGHSIQLNDASAGSTEYLASAPILLACAATAIGVVWTWHLTRLQMVMVFALAVASAGVFLINGDRRFLLPCVLVPVVAYYLSVDRRPGRKLLAAAIPLAFVLLATVPWFRTAAGRAEFGGIPTILAQSVTSPLTAWNRFITLNDTEMESALSVQLQVQRDPGDFYYGRATFGDLLLAPIPSAIFPGKPVTARNDMLTRAFGAPCTVSANHYCPDFSVIGTFYQDLWWPGVFLGMAALGAFSRAIWARYLDQPRSPYRVVTAATWAILLPILIRAGFMPSFAWWLYFLVPTVAVIALSKAIARRLDGAGRGPAAPTAMRPGS
jgi:hypothetical protein